MIYWYDDLYMDQPVRREEEKCRRTIEKRSFWQKLPWKKNWLACMEPEASWIPVAEAFLKASPLEEAGVN